MCSISVNFRRVNNKWISCVFCTNFRPKSSFAYFETTENQSRPSKETDSVPAKKVSSLKYCVDLVKQRDYESYLCSLLLPRRARAAVFSLRAFNVELANIREQIDKHAGTAGVYRLQFWKDTVNALYPDGKEDGGLLPKQPVADALQKFVAPPNGQVSKQYLMDLVQGRLGTLEDKPYESVNHLEAYALKTHGAMLFATLEALGFQKNSGTSNDADFVERVEKAYHVASELAKAMGFVTLLRSIGPLASRGIVLVPEDLMEANKVTVSEILNEEFTVKLKLLSWKLGDLAHAHLKEARRWKDVVPVACRPAFLCAVVVDKFLIRLADVKANLSDPQLYERDPLLPIKLGIEKLFRNF